MLKVTAACCLHDCAAAAHGIRSVSQERACNRVGFTCTCVRLLCAQGQCRTSHVTRHTSHVTHHPSHACAQGNLREGSDILRAGSQGEGDANMEEEHVSDAGRKATLAKLSRAFSIIDEQDEGLLSLQQLLQACYPSARHHTHPHHNHLQCNRHTSHTCTVGHGVQRSAERGDASSH